MPAKTAHKQAPTWNDVKVYARKSPKRRVFKMVVIRRRPGNMDVRIDN